MGLWSSERRKEERREGEEKTGSRTEDGGG